jgi:archaellum component FlaC
VTDEYGGIQMSFKRSDLSALGIEPEKIQTLIDWHMETVKGLQAEIDKSKDNEDKLAKVTAELDKVKKDLETANNTIETAEKDDYKGKYESATQELEKLKNDYAAKEISAKRDSIIKQAAKERKYSDEAISILLDSKADYAAKIELDKDGNATNLDDIFKTIASDKHMLTPKVETSTAKLANPPANTGGTKPITKAEIMAIKNTAERQQKIAENPELFGIAKD